MRKSLIFIILVTSIAAAVVKTSMWPRAETILPVDVSGTIAETMPVLLETGSRARAVVPTAIFLRFEIVFAQVWDFRARLQRPSKTAEILD